MATGVQAVLRRAGFGAAGGLFLLLGGGFLTAAAWLALALAHGGLFASVILGLAFCGIGMLCLALASRKAAPPPVTRPARPDLLSAFLGGMNTGKALARRNR